MRQLLSLSVVEALSKIGRRPGQDKIVVATSGGPDSTALLHLTVTSQDRHGFQATAVYIDHGLRPKETPAEEAMLERLTGQLGIRLQIFRVDTFQHAALRGLSLEHAARELRYERLHQAYQRLDAAAILLGHTMDDQVEGILLRLMRGGGSAALAGMATVSRHLVRPLLSCTKAELLAYLERCEVEYCLDSSNVDPRFLRNRIRHHLLPLLEEQYDPGIRQALLKSAAILRQEDDLLAELSEQALDQVVVACSLQDDAPWMRLDRQRLSVLHPALQRRVVEGVFHRLEAVPSHRHILAVVRLAASGVGGRQLHLKGGLRVRLDQGYLCFGFPRGRGPWRG